MDFFSSKQLKAFEGIPTPFFFYDLDVLENTLLAIKKEIDDVHYKVHYAIKANANERILRIVKNHGFGIDGVSGNEVHKAMELGFQPSEIAFAGVGKTDQEIRYAIEKGIYSLNVESIPELIVINELAVSMDCKANVAIRLNPNVNPNTHKYITTGLEENKFGINYWELPELFHQLNGLQNIQFRGIHFHIGSQVRDLTVFKNLCNRVNELQKEFYDRGFELEHINVGGGLGVNYTDPDSEMIPDFNAFFDVFKQFIELKPQQELHFELGRAIVAQCAALISRVLFVKNGIKTNFAIIDAGMTELIRPALYQSSHFIENISNDIKEKSHKYDVVGPICESSDCFGKALAMAPTKRGDLIAIRSAGAYGQVMSSSYNLRDLAKTIYHDEI